MAEKYYGIEKYIFSDVYLFFLRFKDMYDTDHNWEICTREANELYKKYKDNPFLKDMVSITMLQLESRVSGRISGGKTAEQWDDILKEIRK